MSEPGNSKLRDFTQKLRSEGSAAFAAGPWDDVRQAEAPPRSASARQRATWARHAVQAGKPGERSSRGLEDRILAWVAIVALTTFVIGILGTYLTYKPGSRPATTRIEPGTPVPPDPARLEARLSALEARFRQLLDPLRERLQALEQQLVINSNQFEARLLELESSLPPAGQGIGARLQQLEQELADTTGRVEQLSFALAARNVAPEAPSGDAAALREVALREPAATAWPEPAPAALAAPQNPDHRNDDRRPALKPLPAAQGSVVRMPVEEIAESSLRGPIERREPAPVPEALPAEQAQILEPAAPAMESTPTMASLPADQPVQKQPVTAIAETSATAHAEPATGDWSINIASYMSPGIADSKVEKFRQRGVDAVRTSATVNGKTIYRVRVTGFASRREAEAEAAVVRKRLGLKETWVTRR